MIDKYEENTVQIVLTAWMSDQGIKSRFSLYIFGQKCMGYLGRAWVPLPERHIFFKMATGPIHENTRSALKEGT
jgi:hypothetical protein